MAKVELSELHNSVSGGLGRHVYRRNRKGGASVARRPGKRTGPPSSVQLEVQNRFRTAAAFARDAVADPVLREVYHRAAIAGGRNSPYHAAVTDYFTPPVVHVIDVSRYHGAIGDKIKVLASDDADVLGVVVALKDASGTVLESGAAMLVNQGWVYTATTVRPAGQPVTIEATATDRPGNAGAMTKAITVT
jgi:hypothetical protein